MGFNLGIHVGSLEMGFDELSRLAVRADEAGFYWFSVSDHFYANPIQDGKREQCLEGVSSMAAIAALTKRVRVGCLVFCSLFRNPGLLAKSAVTIDHVSGGRAEIGMGAGWFQTEFEEFNYRFPPVAERMDQLEEALQVMRGMLSGEPVHFRGRYYQFDGTVCTPRPAQERLRIWIGGRGPKRTPRMAAQYADGFNVAYTSAADYAERIETVHRACDRFQRDPATLACTINLGFYMGADEKAAARNRKEVERFDETRAKGMLTGTPPEVVERIAEYQRAGAQGLNIALRAPVDWEAIEAFIEQVLPHFRGNGG